MSIDISDFEHFFFDAQSFRTDSIRRRRIARDKRDKRETKLRRNTLGKSYVHVTNLNVIVGRVEGE